MRVSEDARVPRSDLWPRRPFRARSQNHPSFQGGRHDQAILSALFYKLGHGLALADQTWPADTAPIIAASRRRHD